jgi:hypothetical protein
MELEISLVKKVESKISKITKIVWSFEEDG